MLQALKTMAKRYDRYMTMVGRRKAREVLLNSSDRMLADAGFSRELLEKGVAAWPWLSADADQSLQPVNYDALTTRHAVSELQDYSDNDLHDLGITRGKIKDAVQHGREGIDRHTDRKVA